MSKFDKVTRDHLMVTAELEQLKAYLRDVILEMPHEWCGAIMETCRGINDDNCRPPLAAMARFAEVGLMTVFFELSAECDEDNG